MPVASNEIIPGFILNGQKYRKTQTDVIESLDTFVPLEMNCNRKYYIEHKGERFPIKQVVSEITGQPRSSFLASDAYRILLNLGFEIKNLDYS